MVENSPTHLPIKPEWSNIHYKRASYENAEFNHKKTTAKQTNKTRLGDLSPY